MAGPRITNDYWLWHKDNEKAREILPEPGLLQLHQPALRPLLGKDLFRLLCLFELGSHFLVEPTQ
jgi:hypothetical protein